MAQTKKGKLTEKKTADQKKVEDQQASCPVMDAGYTNRVAQAFSDLGFWDVEYSRTGYKYIDGILWRVRLLDDGRVSLVGCVQGSIPKCGVIRHMTSDYRFRDLDQFLGMHAEVIAMSAAVLKGIVARAESNASGGKDGKKDEPKKPASRKPAGKAPAKAQRPAAKSVK